DVGEQSQLVPVADGTRSRRGFPHVPRRTQELGVGVADVEARKDPAPEVAKQRPLRQRVVDGGQQGASLPAGTGALFGSGLGAGHVAVIVPTTRAISPWCNGDLTLLPSTPASSSLRVYSFCNSG